MAFRFVDPTPFLPHGGQRIMIPNRKVMSRVVLGRARRSNNDVAIVTIEPFPAHQVSFLGIHDVMDDFLRNHKRVGYRTIQPCPFGQAYVKFRAAYDRDFLIQGSPHEFGDARISFSEHNKGWNNATTTMNHDVWLMLLGFNIDYWEREDVDKAIADFDRVLSWVEDPNHLARIIVKARVANLTEIPWFIVCSEGENFEGDCWTAQCEILQTNMLGGGAQDEEIPPGPDDLQPNLFDFFGYGQPGHGPNAMQGFQGQQVNQVDDHIDEIGNAVAGWGIWPNAPNQMAQQQDIELNAQPIPGEPFLELNDIINEANNNNPVDLNFPPPEDLGGLDEYIPEPDIIMAEDQGGGNVQIIADDDLPEIALPEVGIGLQEQGLNNINLEVFIPMEDGHQLLDIGDEINEDELLGHDPIEPQEIEMADPIPNNDAAPMMMDNQEDQIIVPDNEGVPSDASIANSLNLQLGFVELVEPDADPVFTEWLSQGSEVPKSIQHPEAVRLWAKFLSPMAGCKHVNIPTSWSAFFTAMLLNPTSFVWAKQLLSSAAWGFFQNQDSMIFALPNKCPEITSLCLNNLPRVDLSKEQHEEALIHKHLFVDKVPSTATPDSKDCAETPDFGSTSSLLTS